MAANYYLSTHANYHLHSRIQHESSKVPDLRYATVQEIEWLNIWSGSMIQKLCKRLGLRQQVIATAIVYLRRFYLRNSYAETDPLLVAAACCYVAAKAEETPVHVKSVVVEARAVFASVHFDNIKLAEMEFYLLEELDFHLIIFHPYRSLVQLCGRDGGVEPPTGAVEDGQIVQADRTRREHMLDLDDAALQMAWFVINDTFRTSLCLLYSPHLIAIASIYLALSLNPPTDTVHSAPVSTGSAATRTRRQSIPDVATTASSATSASVPAAPTSTGGQTDAVNFLSTLNVDLAIILEIIQEILSLYELWNLLETAAAAPSTSSTMEPTSSGGQTMSGLGTNPVVSNKGKTTTVGADEFVYAIWKRTQGEHARTSVAGDERKSGRRV